MTVYRIHPSVQVEPKDKPIDVLLEMCNGNVALVVGGSTILSLTPRGSIYRFRMSEGAEEALGLNLNEERHIRVECEIGPGVLTTDAVQAERERCLKAVARVKQLDPSYKITQREQALGTEIKRKIREGIESGS